MTAPIGLFCVCAPGLEQFLAAEARELNFTVTEVIPGGVSLAGGWDEALRANLCLRGATRILARIAEFRAFHLAQLDKRTRKLPWDTWLKPGSALRVEAACKKSKIYHQKAAAQRVERALADILGAEINAEAALTIKLRIDDNLCTFSLDTSGASLHKRGLKQRVNKAPMRETLAALFLRAAGFDGKEPVYDPMCGSGTFPLEAADWAAGLTPGRARGFAFEDLALTVAPSDKITAPPDLPTPRYFGSDRDSGAIAMSTENAARAGLQSWCEFACKPISEITPPCDEPGLVILNPPYGARIGNKKPLFGLYGSLGAVLKERFTGWRAALVTSDAALAKASALPFIPPGPIVDHGGQKIRLWQTGPL